MTIERSNNMPDDLQDQLTKMNQKAHSEVETSFTKLTTFINQIDPIKLLSQLTNTFQFAPEGQFIEESSDTYKWARRIEFLAGYLLVNKYPRDVKNDIDGADLKKTEELLDEYFNSLSSFLSTDIPTNENDKEMEKVLQFLKIDSLYVRGESYPHQLQEVAKDIYSQHDTWFATNLGFTINDAFAITESIFDEVNRRINNEKQCCLEQASKHVDELIKSGEAKEEDRKDFVARITCYNYFKNSDVMLSFTLDELAQFSNYSRGLCKSYLDRLSQQFGYRNAFFPDTFTDPHISPWDYNTLNERPIIKYDDKYFIPVLSMFDEVLLHTFYYDLIGDSEYWKHGGEKKYGACLEQKTADLLKRIFPSNEVLLNPEYPNGDELCDVLVLHDRNVFIVQCKMKRLQFDSKIGKNFQLIKDDLNKSVKESFNQAIRARDYFFDNQPAIVKTKNGELQVDSKQITNVFPVSIILGGYQSLITRLANINPALDLFSDNQYPWAISLFDLGIVVELIEYPSMFIHYAKRRLAMERVNFDILADEVDALGFYFSQGLFFEVDDYKKLGLLGLTGHSSAIDKYIFEKYEMGRSPVKPSQKMPPKFIEYIKTVEALNSPYHTDCAIRLLDLNFETRELFVHKADDIKEKTKIDNDIHSFSVTVGNKPLGFSFISMNFDGDLDKLFKQAFMFGVMKKYTTKYRDWVGLGWDSNTDKIVDVAIFLSYDWQEDPAIAKIAEDNLKQGQMTEVDKQTNGG